MPHTVHPSAQYNDEDLKGACSLPRANEHSPAELSRDGRLVLLDRNRDLVRLFFPAILGDSFDALQLERVRIDAFL